MGESVNFKTNLFTNNKISSYGISFIYNHQAYSYDFKYHQGFIYECMKELVVEDGKILEKELFIKDVEKNIYRFSGDQELEEILNIFSNNNILVYNINRTKYNLADVYQQILYNFAEKIDILDMNNMQLEKTINILKNNNSLKNQVVDFIKKADLDIEDYKYKEIVDNVIFNQESDIYNLISVHSKKEVQIVLFDSVGTKKFIAVASYIIDAFSNGRVLVIDDLNNNLHFKLLRAIVSIFNNELNTCAQLIFTAHDMTLLDCKKLFRKDQIWFICNEDEKVYLYSLNDFDNLKINNNTNLFQKYKNGFFGAIPEPDLIEVFLAPYKTNSD